MAARLWRSYVARYTSLLAAIGVTMSLFIGGLAFEDASEVDAVKIGVLAGSLVAALSGFFLIKSALPDEAPAEPLADGTAAEPAQ